MNTALLKLARRDSRGTRYWTVPGWHNEAKLVRSAHTGKGWGPAFHWPMMDPYHPGEQIVYSVCLTRHIKLARRYARELLDASK